MPLAANSWATWCSDSPGMISTSTAWVPMGRGSRVQRHCSQMPAPKAAINMINAVMSERFIASGLRDPGNCPVRERPHGVATGFDALHGPYAGDGVANEHFPTLQQFVQGEAAHLDREPCCAGAFQDMASRHAGHAR